MKRFDIKIAKKYTKAGAEKTQWLKIGTAFESDKGLIVLVVDMIPTNWDGRASLFVPEVRDNSAMLGMRDSKKEYEPDPNAF